MLTKEIKEEIEALRVKEASLEKKRRSIERELNSLKYVRASHLGNLFDADNTMFHTKLWKVFYNESGNVNVESHEHEVIDWFLEQVGELYDYGVETKFGKFSVTVDDCRVSINILYLNQFVDFLIGVNLSIDVAPFSEAFARYTAVAEQCKKVMDFTLEKMNSESFPKGTPQERGGRRNGTHNIPRIRTLNSSSGGSGISFNETLRAVAAFPEETPPPGVPDTSEELSGLELASAENLRVQLNRDWRAERGATWQLGEIMETAPIRRTDTVASEEER